MRWVPPIALFALACASAPTARAPVRWAPRIEPSAPAEAAPIPLEELAARARQEVEESAGQVLAEHRDRLDGESSLHLVLEQGRCYRAWIGADGAFAARLVDEHGHTVASGDSDASLWLGEPAICPRWSGSFALVVEERASAEDLAVLLVRTP